MNYLENNLKILIQLIAILKNDTINASLREQAATGLLIFGDKKAIPILKEILQKESNYLVQRGTKSAIKRLSEEE